MIAEASDPKSSLPDKALERLSEKIRKTMVRAMSDFHMIEEGDRVLAAVSGGKDSATMLIHLEEIRKRAKFRFTVDALLVNQKQPWFDAEQYLAWMTGRGFFIKMIEDDVFNVALQKTRPGKSLCRICSRLRRGVLYTYARKNGYTKIALGHHRDDLNETLLMNMFFSGRIAAMPPKLVSNDGHNVVIRPMCYVEEEKIIAYKEAAGIPVMTCDPCESQDKAQRQKMKTLLKGLESTYPGLEAILLKSMKNIKPSRLLDKDLFDFHEF
ncbi:MAG: tRNA 2-thiocytidine(32) synthetase TtcA [Proteobacteria bacterium]|nr:tRNA 2-thiocytidine(32) synthetase TtcA [Pseudomonadota bacterium]